MITHIDYDEDVWDRNAVNADPNHQHVRMMAADNSWTKSTQSGDLYPGLLNNTSFTDSSNRVPHYGTERLFAVLLPESAWTERTSHSTWE